MARHKGCGCRAIRSPTDSTPNLPTAKCNLTILELQEVLSSVENPLNSGLKGCYLQQNGHLRDSHFASFHFVQLADGLLLKPMSVLKEQ